MPPFTMLLGCARTILFPLTLLRLFPFMMFLFFHLPLIKTLLFIVLTFKPMLFVFFLLLFFLFLYFFLLLYFLLFLLLPLLLLQFLLMLKLIKSLEAVGIIHFGWRICSYLYLHFIKSQTNSVGARRLLVTLLFHFNLLH